MNNNPLEHVKPEHLEPLKQLVPHLALNLEVYIFGDSAVRNDYSGRVQLEVITEGCRFLHEMTPEQIKQGIVSAAYMTHSANPLGWDPRESTPVIQLLNRIGELYSITLPYNTPATQSQDGILEAIVIRDGGLIDLMKNPLEYGGRLSYARCVIRYHHVEFEVYVTRAPLPGSENIRRITTGPRIILPDESIGSKSRVED